MPPPADTSTVIDIDRPRGDRAVDVAWLRDRLDRAISHLNRPVARIGISLVDDARMIELHARHLNLNTTTDVLTFHLSKPGQPIDVDLALCVDEAARQAAGHGHTIERELLLYALHGLLHCCGFDDHEEVGAAAIHAEEDRILSAIGVGATFAASQPPAARDASRQPAGGKGTPGSSWC